MSQKGELSGRLEREADPRLDEAQGLVENVKENLDEIEADTKPITGPESGADYSVVEAVARVEEFNAKIKRDQDVGKHHHHRASRPRAGQAQEAEVVLLAVLVAHVKPR